MWWPGPTAGHVDRGAQAGRRRRRPAPEWGLADGEQGGRASTETYILIANTSAFAGHRAGHALLRGRRPPAQQRTCSLPPNSRTNVAVGASFRAVAAGKRFGTVIESLSVAGQDRSGADRRRTRDVLERPRSSTVRGRRPSGNAAPVARTHSPLSESDVPSTRDRGFNAHFDWNMVRAVLTSSRLSHE